MLIGSPDVSATGLLGSPVDSLRYDNVAYNRYEVTGLLHELMPTKQRVLDVGCGTGCITLLANEGRGNTVVGIEPDANRAERARRRGLDVRTGFLTDELQDELGLFSVVMASDVLEHTPAPGAFLETLKRSLEPAGYLLLSVPNVAHWAVRKMLFRGRFDYTETGIMDATHLRWFTSQTLEQLLLSSGFRILNIRFAVGTWLPEYSTGLFARLPHSVRERLLRKCTDVAPNLFGAQIVVKAQMWP